MTEGRTQPPPWHPLAWADALTQFARTEIAGGLVLVVALIGALAWANIDPHGYVTVWAHRVISGSDQLPGTLRSVANEIDNGLMTIFFLSVGLEIGREVAEGSLRDRRNALLPVVAAGGGMAGAAVVYLVTVAVRHSDGRAARGWGIPMATDVAFTLGAIALLGRRVPQPLRVFVLALAVADDVGSVVVLALVASTKIHLAWLAGAIAVLALTFLFRRRWRDHGWPYLVITLVAWYLFARAGVEPTLAGAFVGLLVPVAGGARAGRSLERPVHLAASYVVLPLFVLANAGVVLTGIVWHSSGGTSVVSAVFAARILGKLFGITLAVAVMVRLGVCGLPEHTTWRHMIGVSLLCGMGITVPLLFAHAVFDHAPILYSGAQIGLILSTLGAALAGAAVLWGARREPVDAESLPTPPALRSRRARTIRPAATMNLRKEGGTACELD
jgi:Na+:H+ antiporter, NhaA family